MLLLNNRLQIIFLLGAGINPTTFGIEEDEKTFVAVFPLTVMSLGVCARELTDRENVPDYVLKRGIKKYDELLKKARDELSSKEGDLITYKNLIFNE